MSPSHQHVSESMSSTISRLRESKLSTPEKEYYGQLLDSWRALQNGDAGKLIAIGKAIGQLLAAHVNYVIDHALYDEHQERRHKQLETRLTEIEGRMKEAVVEALKSVQQKDGSIHVTQAHGERVKVVAVKWGIGGLVVLLLAALLIAAGKADGVLDIFSNTAKAHMEQTAQKIE